MTIVFGISMVITKHRTALMGQGEAERLGSLLAGRPVTPRLIERNG